MAQEITAVAGLSVNKTNLKRTPLVTTTQRPDMAGTRFTAGSQDVGTSVEALVFGSDMTTAGWGVFTNLDATNYISIGPNNGTPYFLRIYPGMSVVVSLDNLTIYALAGTATVKLGWEIYER